jgi:hypothetical protein
MASGALSALQLTRAYLDRIDACIASGPQRAACALESTM